MAFVHDAEGAFARRVNPDSVVLTRIASVHWDGVLRALVAEHVGETGSKWGAELLLDWDRSRGDFWQVCPKEMLGRLVYPLDDTAVMVAAE